MRLVRCKHACVRTRVSGAVEKLLAISEPFKSKSVKFTVLLFFDSIQTFRRRSFEKRTGLADFADFSPNLKFF